MTGDSSIRRPGKNHPDLCGYTGDVYDHVPGKYVLEQVEREDEERGPRAAKFSHRSVKPTIFIRREEFPEKIKEGRQSNQDAQTSSSLEKAPISKTIEAARLNNTCSVQRKGSVPDRWAFQRKHFQLSGRQQ